MSTMQELETIDEQLIAINRNDDIVPVGWYGFAQPLGWAKIVLDLYIEIEAVSPGHKVLQVKEKFGGLRYYCESNGRDDVQALIYEAEKLAADTCQVCGSSPAATRSNPRGWIATICANHAEQFVDGTPLWKIDEGEGQ